MKALIIDDEIKARILLNTILNEYCDDVKVVGFSESVDEALILIQNLNPDIVFLDIELKGETGFDLLDKLDHKYNFKLIFVTAYKEYAIDAIKSRAFDYILKPIQIDELIKTIEKVKYELIKAPEISEVKKTTLYVKGDSYIIEQKNIIYIEADGRYSNIHISKENKCFLQTKNIGLFESELDSELFIRVHKSYLINKNYIESFHRITNTIILKTQKKIPVSRRKISELINLFQKK